ncbi:MAG TPA: UDPGP type 1 family protein [Sedimentisphaerales bacterium]|nr:UDPGP type 1 family protein [Sedimentisphaerales bacterium]
MVEKNVFENTKKLLQAHNQDHLLAFWHQLTPAQRHALTAQIAALDFARIDHWLADVVAKPPLNFMEGELKPADFFPHLTTAPHHRRKYLQAREFGSKLISAGKVAAFVVAGGQATRLGAEGPKGDLPVSPLKKKTLFQLFAETISAASQTYHTICPWYVMTSPFNYDQTLEIFHENHYYGLDRSNVFIFRQGTLPNFDLEGKILLADKATLSSSPDGHGGSLKAISQSGALNDMTKRGIEFISYFQVDNPLVNIFDPLFIGLHALENAEMSSKAVQKTRPHEKVGVFSLVQGSVRVIEYSDLPRELAEKRNPDGSLSFGLGSIAIHIISVSFVKRLATAGLALPLHRAVKKIPHINQNGKLVEPAAPNGIKLETFVFDALNLAKKSVILETLRNQEFAPVKNAAGPDSPRTAKVMQVARAVDWLKAAGVALPLKPDGSPDCLVEIAPSFALQKEDIKLKLDRIPQIKPGDNIYLA